MDNCLAVHPWVLVDYPDADFSTVYNGRLNFCVTESLLFALSFWIELNFITIIGYITLHVRPSQYMVGRNSLMDELQKSL